ncbi:septum formation initiator family protein [Streptomyces sp. NPDC051207]|uniref:FtsB family cell division protein n=1 Tax=Streptomyces sp. NPDC051207 TaxID=3154641 RepID=UPI00343B890D
MLGRKPELRGRAARLAQLFPTGQGRQAARTPFVLLVVLLLGGGLIGLLVLNSALSEGSFRLDDLQRQTQELTDEEQALQRDVDAYSAPDALQRRARELGMIPGGDPAFLGPDGRIKGVPGPAADRRTSHTMPLLLPPAAQPTEGPATGPTPAPTPQGPVGPAMTPTPGR